MKNQPEHREHQHEEQSRDRSDWISKYLELADRIIQTHMPQAPEQEKI